MYSKQIFKFKVSSLNNDLQNVNEVELVL